MSPVLLECERCLPPLLSVIGPTTVENVCCGCIFFLQEHHRRTEKESTLFPEIARGPLDCDDIENSEHSSDLGERDDFIHMLLTFTRGPSKCANLM